VAAPAVMASIRANSPTSARVRSRIAPVTAIVGAPKMWQGWLTL
jgi:hypothetical protein